MLQATSIHAMLTIPTLSAVSTLVLSARSRLDLPWKSEHGDWGRRFCGNTSDVSADINTAAWGAAANDAAVRWGRLNLCYRRNDVIFAWHEFCHNRVHTPSKETSATSPVIIQRQPPNQIIRFMWHDDCSTRLRLIRSFSTRNSYSFISTLSCWHRNVLIWNLNGSFTVLFLQESTQIFCKSHSTRLDVWRTAASIKRCMRRRLTSFYCE